MGALLRHSELLAWHWFSLLLNTFHPRGETAHIHKQTRCAAESIVVHRHWIAEIHQSEVAAGTRQYNAT